MRKAIAEFQDIVQERPDAAGAWYYTGLCEFKLNATIESNSRFRSIDLLEIQSPSSADIAGAWYTIGVSFYLASLNEKAIAPLNRYLDITAIANRD